MVSLAISCFGSAHRPLGLAAATTGDLDEAVAQLETALLADLAVGHGPAHVMDSMALADVLDRRHGDNDPTRAAALRTGGIAEARRYDMESEGSWVGLTVEFPNHQPMSTPDQPAMAASVLSSGAGFCTSC